MTEAWFRLTIPALVFAVYFLYPIPHTVALRNLLLAILLVSAFRQLLALRPRPERADWSAFQPSAWLLGTLTTWLVLQSLFISPLSSQALELLRGDWLMSLIAIGVAALSVRVCGRSEHVLRALVMSLFLHTAGLLVYQTVLWSSTGQYPLGVTPFGQKDYHSTLVTALAALALADLLGRLTIRQGLMSISWHWSFVTLALCSVASLTLQARNATIIIALLLLAGTVLFVTVKRASPRRTLSLAIFVIALLSAGTWIGLHSDTRWSGFTQAAIAALDTKHNLAWLDEQQYPRPLMDNGQPVDHSAYMRLSWAKVGLEQIGIYPLGLGYGHKAFGWAVDRSYGVETGLESSHSGLIDFTLANGIPGLLLWLALSGALITAGWRTFRRHASPTGLALALSVGAYLVRCMLDGHLSGFRLEMYAFLVGTLAMTQMQERRRCA